MEEKRATGRVNLNGRVYPPEVVRKAVEDMQARVKAGSLFGGLVPFAQGRVNLAQASHVVRKVSTPDGVRIIGEIEILDTPEGRKLDKMLKGGGVGFSMSGVGSVKGNVVQTDFKPSTLNIILGSVNQPEVPEDVVTVLSRIPLEEEDGKGTQGQSPFEEEEGSGSVREEGEAPRG